MTLYSFDTSGLMDGWNRYYPPDVFPPLWEEIDASIGKQEIACTEEVLREIAKKDDALHGWVKGHNGFFIPIDQAQQEAVGEILTAFPRLVDTRRNRSQADPFVIALARVRKAVVVTGERSSGTSEKPRIPNVCDHFGVRCIGLLEFIRERKLKFARG